MNDTPVGPRRYKVQFECSGADVAQIWGLLVNDVDPPTTTPSGNGAFKIAFVCLFDQIPTVTGLLIQHVASVDRLIVAPDIPAPSTVSSFARIAPKPQPISNSVHALIRRVPSKRTRVAGGAKPSERTTGRVVLEVLKHKPIVHAPDIADAFEQAGLKASSVSVAFHALMREGVIIKCGHGAYRLPTAAESLEIMARRPSPASPQQGEG